MTVDFKNLFVLFRVLINKGFSFISNPPERLNRKIVFIQSPFLIILTLIPIINIAHIIATSGENNLSNDVVMWVDMVDKVLHHDLSLKTFIIRSFFTPYFIPLYIASEMLNAFLFEWNIKVTLFFGFFLNLIKLTLLFDLFTFRYKKNPFRWFLLPIVSALVFSNMEVTTFTGENTSILIGMSLVGAVISIWGIVRFRAQIKGVLVCTLGGMISTWTFGLGLIVWPLSLLGMILLGFRKAKQYLVWFIGALVCTLPFFIFYFFKPTQLPQPINLNLQSFLNFNFMVNLLGRPLVNLWTFDMTRQYKITGLIGIVLAVACLVVFLLSLRSKKYAVFVPPLLVSALGLGGVWLASTGRTTLASWYITAAWPFWQGIVGFSFILLMQPVVDEISLPSLFEFIKKSGGVFIIFIIAFLYARSNVGNEVYGFLLYSRTPASASCLRSYQYAPTYCESYLFQWPIQRPEYIFELGRPLGRNQLSAASRQQQWSLQGDFIFDRVEVIREPITAPIGWYEGLSGKRTSWFGIKRWHHLDLMLQSPNAIKWTVDFPDYLESAVLKSAIGILNDNAVDPEADGLTFRVTVEGNSIEPKTILEQHVQAKEHTWTPFSYDLSSYRGKKVTIEFTSLPGKNNVGDFAMYQYPVIDVTVAKHIDDEKNITYTPENTDVYPGFTRPVAKDEIWNGKDLTFWSLSHLEPVKDKPGYYIGGEDPQFQLKEPVNLCLADYTHFYIKFAMPEGTPRVTQIFFQLNDNQPISEERSFSFTTFADGKVHMYTYPIRLLDLNVPYNTRLINVRFDPTSSLKNINEPIQIIELGLLRGEKPSICQ